MSIDTLRYYEAEGLVHPARDSRGRRWYTAHQIEALIVVRTLRDAGFGVRHVATVLASRREEDSSTLRLDRFEGAIDVLQDALTERRALLDDADKLLDRWRAGIAQAREAIAAGEDPAAIEELP